YFKNLSKGDQIKKAGAYGFATVGYSIVMKEVAQACSVPGFRKTFHLTQTLSDRSENEVSLALKGNTMPANIGYSIWNLKIDPELTPSCKTKEGKNFIAESIAQQGCLLQGLLSLAPLKISLPLTFAL
ncbi:MAG: hypothetical protein ACXWC9_09455, partial [Pseudobdellovibrionaceae bacterium]